MAQAGPGSRVKGFECPTQAVGAARRPMVVYVALAYAISWAVWAGHDCVLHQAEPRP